MKSLTFLLASASLFAQQPQSEARIPREPSTGDASKMPAPYSPPNAPATTTTVPFGQDRADKPVPPAVLRAILDGQAATDVQFDQPMADGALWAVGADYKASFESSQWTYIARPTANADHAQPLTFHLATAQVGGRELDLASSAAPQRDGNRVRLQHGAVVETLALSMRAVEQTFTFTALPQRGELIVGIDLTTELHGAIDGAGLRFTSEWLDVGYTAAIAIDADGDRIAAPTRLVNGRIEIRVPAAFVETASLPLVIDPVVSSGTAISGSVDVGNPDLVFAPGSNEWHVTYQRFFANGDWDCYVRRMSATFAPIGTATIIDATANNWFRPRIAHVQNSGVSMVVAELRLGSNPIKVSARIMNNAGTTTTSQFDVSSSSNKNSTVPDVGGDPFPGTSYFTVVWEHSYSTTDHDIYARQVTPTGALRGTGPTLVQASTAYQSNPSISKSDGGGSGINQRFAIVYQQQAPALDWDIYGALMTWDGALQLVNSAYTFPIDTSIASTVLPTVSSPTFANSTGKRQFLCAYESVWSNAGDIEMSAFDTTGVVSTRRNLVALEGNLVRLSWAQHFPSVDCDGTRFAVGYHENWNGSATDLDARIATVSFGNNEMWAMDSSVLGGSGTPEFAVQIASRYASSGTQDTGYATVNDRDTSGTYMIEGDRYDANPTGLALVRTTSCGGGVFINMTGDPMPGNTLNFSLTATSQLAGFAFGPEASISLPGCSCIIGVSSVLSTIGNTTIINLPMNSSLIGARLSTQAWMLGATGTSCLANIHLSDTLDIIVR